jgi:hypothetical protein
MKAGVGMPLSGNAAGSRGIASIDEVTGGMYPIRHRLSPLRERSSPAAGHCAPPPRESFRRRLVNATLVARPRRTVGLGYV